MLAQADGSSPELAKADPLLALKAKTAIVPEGVVSVIARLFKPLFFRPVVVAVLGAFFALSAWLLAYHGVAQSLRQTFYDPLFILLLLGLVAVSAAFHECGHATACHYGGAKPGTMGAGIYIVWPAFFTDVTDAYRLGKAGRLRTDLGGVYFNAIFTLATFGAYFLTRWEPLLIVVPLQIMEMLHQLLPFIRLDGYYVVGDLTGVPDMFARIKPTLKSLNPLSRSPAEVLALKPWVRTAVTFYVFTVVPLLVFLLGLTVVNAPRIAATAWSALLAQNARLHLHLAAAHYLNVAVDAIQMAVLVLPVAGLYATFWKLGRRVVDGTWSWTEGSPPGAGAARRGERRGRRIRRVHLAPERRLPSDPGRGGRHVGRGAADADLQAPQHHAFANRDVEHDHADVHGTASARARKTGDHARLAGLERPDAVIAVR